MQTLVVDTNGIVKKLEQRGFSRTQAEGITEALQELDASNLVTKNDLELALSKANNHDHHLDDWRAPRPGSPRRRPHSIF